MSGGDVCCGAIGVDYSPARSGRLWGPVPVVSDLGWVLVSAERLYKLPSFTVVGSYAAVVWAMAANVRPGSNAGDGCRVPGRFLLRLGGVGERLSLDRGDVWKPNIITWNMRPPWTRC